MIEGILDVLFGRPSLFRILGNRTPELKRYERGWRYRHRVMKSYRYEA